MNGRLLKRIGYKLVLIFTALIITAGMSEAASYYLKAERFMKAMPDGTGIVMWGFASCTDASFVTCGALQVPGPVLEVPFSDVSLEVTVLNLLTEAVSIVIPGQTAVLSPVTFIDTANRLRVRSLPKMTKASQ